MTFCVLWVAVEQYVQTKHCRTTSPTLTTVNPQPAACVSCASCGQPARWTQKRPPVVRLQHVPRPVPHVARVRHSVTAHTRGQAVTTAAGRDGLPRVGVLGTAPSSRSASSRVTSPLALLAKLVKR